MASAMTASATMSVIGPASHSTVARPARRSTTTVTDCGLQQHIEDAQVHKHRDKRVNHQYGTPKNETIPLPNATNLTDDERGDVGIRVAASFRYCCC